MSTNLELYKVFYHTAKLRSFSGAAKELFITQPAVSQAIKQLENELGGQLFFRNAKGVMLTQEGEVLFHYIEQAYQLIATGEKKVTEIHTLLNGEIRIGASDTMCKYYLLPYLESFHCQYPGVKIQVTNRTTPETIKLLKAGQVDLGCIILPYEDDQLLIRKGRPIQECFVGGEKFKELATQTCTLNDLTRYPILLLEKGTNTRRFVDQFAAQNGLVLTPEIELGSIDVLVQFAKIGLGISFVIRDFIREDLKAGRLVEIKTQEKIPGRAIGIVTLSNIPLSKAAEEFIRLLGEE